MIPTLRNLVFQDLWLKLFSFALAVLIWFTVDFATKTDDSHSVSLSLAPREQRTLHELPVLVMCPADELRGFVVSPKVVEVTVEGEANLVQKLQEKEIHVIVDLGGINSAQELSKRLEVTTPPGVKAIRVSPEVVQISFLPKS